MLHTVLCMAELRSDLLTRPIRHPHCETLFGDCLTPEVGKLPFGRNVKGPRTATLWASGRRIDQPQALEHRHG